MSTIDIVLAKIDEPFGPSGIVFPEHVCRDMIHSLQGKPVFSSRTGRRIGTIRRVVVTSRDEVDFTPGRRKLGRSPRLVATVDLDGTYEGDVDATLLWEGAGRRVADTGVQEVERAVSMGVVVSRATDDDGN